jgi:hypothetical protein
MGRHRQLYADDSDGYDSGHCQICLAMVTSLDGRDGKILLHLHGKLGCRTCSQRQVLYQCFPISGLVGCQDPELDGCLYSFVHHPFDDRHVGIQYSFDRDSKSSRFCLDENQYGFYLFFNDLYVLLGDVLFHLGN